MSVLFAWFVVVVGLALVIGGVSLAYPPLGLVLLGLVVLAAGGLLIDIGE